MPLLDWVNRNQAEETADQVPYHLLKFEKSYGDSEQAKDNLIIQGDNLQALKALLPLYGGQVKCIFIDPPYNTEQAFDHYDDKLEHAQWLSLIYPRLQLLKELLSEDGSIWITVDDNQSHYLKVICDEVFGRNNFVSNVIWQSTDNSNNDAKQFSVDHNHLIVYSKKENWRPNFFNDESKRKHFRNPDNDPKGAYFDGNPLNSPKPRPNLTYEITAPNGNIIKPPKNGWRWSKKTLYKKIHSGEIRFNEDNTNIRRRTYLVDMEGLPPSTVWTNIDETGHNRQAKYELKKLFPNLETSKLFSTPKPEKLIYQIFRHATEEGDLVLDSFLGSGTTCAVAHKMNRKYIGIEIGEHAKTYVIPRLQKVIEGEQGGISVTKSYYDLKEDTLKDLDLEIDSIKGFNTVFQNIVEELDLKNESIVKDIKRATKIQKVKSKVLWEGGGGFSFYTLGSPVFDEQGFLSSDVKFSDLASYVWWLETGSSLQTSKADSPYIGTYNNIAYYLIYNGILGDRRPNSGNILTHKVLSLINDLHQHEGKRVIIGEASRIGEPRLEALNIEFKQIPYALYGTQASKD